MNTVTIVRIGNEIVVNGRPVGEAPLTDHERNALERFLAINERVKIKSSVYP